MTGHYHCEFCDAIFDDDDQVCQHMMNEHIWNNKALYERWKKHRKES